MKRYKGHHSGRLTFYENRCVEVQAAHSDRRQAAGPGQGLEDRLAHPLLQQQWKAEGGATTGQAHGAAKCGGTVPWPRRRGDHQHQEEPPERCEGTGETQTVIGELLYYRGADASREELYTQGPQPDS